MSNNTKISWTSISWNIMTGCTPISDGCNDCYAKKLSLNDYKLWDKRSIRTVLLRPYIPSV